MTYSHIIVTIILLQVLSLKSQDTIIVIPDISKNTNTIVDRDNNYLALCIGKNYPDNWKVISYTLAKTKGPITSFIDAKLIKESTSLALELIDIKVKNPTNNVIVVASGMGIILANIASWQLKIFDPFKSKPDEKDLIQYSLYETRKKMFPTIEKQFNIVLLSKSFKRNSKDLENNSIKRRSTGYAFLKSLGEMREEQPIFINHLIMINAPPALSSKKIAPYYKPNIDDVIAYAYNLWSNDVKIKNYFGETHLNDTRIKSIEFQLENEYKTHYFGCFKRNNNSKISVQTIESMLSKNILKLIKSKNPSTIKVGIFNHLEKEPILYKNNHKE